jgi:hypothetical protein
LSPYYADDKVTLYAGDCLDVLVELPDASVDAVVTDPPYGLEFMGKDWDDFSGDNRQPFRGEIQTPDNPYGRSTVRFSGSASYGGKHLTAMRQFQDWCELWTTECLRVLKPGGHLLAFGGSRTFHRLACAVEDAGFEIRDSIAWLYGSGFPKSLNVTDALGRIVPPDARCACDPHSTQTALGSLDGYPSSHGSDGEPPLSESGSGQASAPSLVDAPARSRDDLPAGAPGAGLANSAPDGGSDHLAIVGSPPPSALRSATSRPSASDQSDMRTSTSTAPDSELRRTADRTRHTRGSGDDSASSSGEGNSHLACPNCNRPPAGRAGAPPSSQHSSPSSSAASRSSAPSPPTSSPTARAGSTSTPVGSRAERVDSRGQ